MLLLVVLAALITRRLSAGPRIGDLQNALEIVVETICQQIREVTGEPCEPYLPFVGTLFLFILSLQPAGAGARLPGRPPGRSPPRWPWRSACSWRCRSTASGGWG